MSTTQITSKEVLSHLNYLGYNNINAEQLKEFIRDLKKLIKYEERRRSKEKMQIQLISIPSKNKKREGDVEANQDDEVQDIFTQLYSHGTYSSQAKAVPKKQSVISVQIKKSKCQHGTHDKENIDDCNKTPGRENIQEKQIQDKQPDKVEVTTNKKRNLARSKSSFIRPQVPVNINKSDPVALYYYYKNHWDRHKFPGEGPRNELRWNVRTKMAQIS